MEKYDPQLAGRVWQRVQQRPPELPDSSPLLALITDKWENAAACMTLAKNTQGREAAVFRKIFEEEQATARTLRGICALQAGSLPPHQSIKPSNEITPARLRRCCLNAMTAARAFEQRCADPEYGPVFQLLAQREREHCMLLLEIIGTPGKTHG